MTILGMKLEALDRKNPELIAVATVKNINKINFMIENDAHFGADHFRHQAELKTAKS